MKETTTLQTVKRRVQAGIQWLKDQQIKLPADMSGVDIRDINKCVLTKATGDQYRIIGMDDKDVVRLGFDIDWQDLECEPGTLLVHIDTLYEQLTILWRSELSATRA